MNFNQSIKYEDGEMKINGMSVDQMRPLYEDESFSTKMRKLCVASCFFGFFLSMGILTAVRASNVGSIQDVYEQQC